LETIYIIIGFAGLIFQAGIQWGINLQWRKSTNDRLDKIEQKMDFYDKDAVEFYKNINNNKRR